MELPPLPEVTSSGFDASNENLDHITSTPLQLEPHSSLQLLGDSAFSSFVSDYSKVLETEISGYETRISALKSEVEGLWSEEKRVEYQLVSVFMHRGESRVAVASPNRGLMSKTPSSRSLLHHCFLL